MKEFEWSKLLFIFDANFLVLSSICFDKNDGEILRFIGVIDDGKWWWSSNTDIRGVVDDDDDGSLTSRDDAAAAAARKNGWDNAAAAAIAAWFGSTRYKFVLLKKIFFR